jgi:hypothetical protein
VLTCSKPFKLFWICAITYDHQQILGHIQRKVNVTTERKIFLNPKNNRMTPRLLLPLVQTVSIGLRLSVNYLDVCVSTRTYTAKFAINSYLHEFSALAQNKSKEGETEVTSVQVVLRALCNRSTKHASPSGNSTGRRCGAPPIRRHTPSGSRTLR